MALTDFILKKGQVVLTQQAISASGMNVSSSSLTYGYVQKVNDLCDMYKVGDYVIFDTSESINFTFLESSVLLYYCLTTEDKVYLIEPLILPP